jgi:type II secretion system protein D
VAFAQSEPTVGAYPCPTGTAQATAKQLRAEFGAVPGVRIAADDRTSQIIVFAPPEAQAPIRRRIEALAAPTDAAIAKIVRGNADAAKSVTIALRHCSPEQLEASLAGILGNRLVAIRSPQPQIRRYRVSSRGGAAVELAIDPAAKRVTLQGPDDASEMCSRLVRAIDSVNTADGRNTRLVPVQTSRPASIRRAIGAVHDTTGAHKSGMPLAAMLFEKQDQNDAQPPAGKTQTPAPASAEKGKTPGGKPRVGLVNPVEIESLEGLDVLVLRGKAQDVEQVLEIINQIERVSAETEPAVQVMPLQHADCRAIEQVIQKLYEEVYEPRQGTVSITAVVKPNALLIVGRPENVQTVIDLAGKLDQPVAPETQFRIFALRNAAAGTAQGTIQEFYKDRGGLGPQIRITADTRSNALLVQAGPRDMEELAALIGRIDTPTSQAVNELRIIQLEHSLARDLADILQSAIGAASGARRGAPAGQAAQSGGQTPPGGQGPRPQGEQRSAMLRFLTIDARGQRLVESGILSDVRITADTRANAIVVSAPAECMQLLEALIHQLDTLPAAEAQIKVFTIVNSDAANLKDMLQTLFAGQGSTGGQSGNRPASAPSGAEGSLVALRFAVDARTNSIIASGSASELSVVEAILMRLDDSEVRQRKNFVFRLKNSYAKDVAQAVDQFLTKQRQMQREQTPGMTSAFEQIEREVVVVPEIGSNSLILSATPRFFEEVKALVEQLDIRPPMVMIQVLIARVDLDNTDEFGIELGLQDGLLFDRSLLSGIQTISTSTTNLNQTTTQTQSIVAAENTPGFNFNSTSPLGNSGAANSVANARQVGGQGLSNFGVGRTGKTGFGGLVLSASSESVNILLRALSECHRLEVLQRPQIMTLDNQSAYIQVGQQVPVIQTMTTNQYGQNFITSMMDVGVVLGVTPRISPDGLVVMEIDANRSEVGPEEQGTPVAVSEGQIIRSPRIERTYAQTTVSAMSGQTVVLGGLIAKSKEELHRKVPLLGDLPLVGWLFRFDSTTSKRSELMIIMTPHIVRGEAEADAIKQAEAARMSWCLGDVIKIHGDAGLRGRCDNWSDAETQVVYPDMKPMTGAEGKPLAPELIPTPEAVPAEKSK